MRVAQLSACSIVAILCVAGTAARAQTSERGDRPAHAGSPARPARGEDSPAHDTRLVFASAESMRGMDVFNQNHEKCGTIRDLVIDRGSGRVRHLVVDTRANMELGGRKVAIPYRAFTWNHERKHLMVDAPHGDRARWPEFNKDRWSMNRGQPSNLAYTLSSEYYRRAPADRFETKVEPTRLLGRVKDIERRTTDETPEKVIVTVVTEDGKEERVSVAPSWYLAGNNISFFREAPVELYVTRRDEGGHSYLVARSIDVEGSKSALYDAEGWPAWQVASPASATEPDATPKPTDRDGTPVRSEALRGHAWVSPLVLASELDGKALHCRADLCGSVDDLVVECVSGRVAFVSIDPDQNFLGIADTKRLVPWGVVSVAGDSRLWIDANKAMVVGAPELPKNLETFGSDGSYKGVYGTFGVPVVDFTSRGAADEKSRKDSSNRSDANRGRDSKEK